MNLKVCLNLKSNVDIVIERIVLECLVLKDCKLQNQKWFQEPEYVPCNVAAGIKYINLENAVEFVLMRQRNPLVRCNTLDNFSY